MLLTTVVPEKTVLTVEKGVTLDNNATGTLEVLGTLVNNGTVAPTSVWYVGYATADTSVHASAAIENNGTFTNGTAANLVNYGVITNKGLASATSFAEVTAMADSAFYDQSQSTVARKVVLGSDVTGGKTTKIGYSSDKSATFAKDVPAKADYTYTSSSAAPTATPDVDGGYTNANKNTPANVSIVYVGGTTGWKLTVT